MPSKRRLEQLKSARAVAVQACKKRNPRLARFSMHKLRKKTIWKANLEPGSGTKARMRVARTQKRERNDENELDLDVEESRAVSPEAPKKEIKWNKGEDKSRGVYGIGSRSSLKRQRKSAQELEEQATKTYDIRALWQQNLDLGMISSTNSQVGLGQLPESQPNDDVPHPLCQKWLKVVYLFYPTKVNGLRS